MENIFKKNTTISRFEFWQQWLFYSSILFVFVGFSLAFLGNTILFNSYYSMLAETFWNTSQLPKDVVYFKNFISGPMGGTLVCSYMLLAFIAYYPFKEKRIWARNAIVVSFGVWFLIDSSICFIFKVYPQIYLINAFSIIVKALPLIFTWNDFKKIE
jgi:hypothetical protein